MSLETKYFFKNEKSIKDVYGRVSKALALGDKKLQDRLFEYMSNGWYSPATPILLNLGTDLADGISCFLNTPSTDSLSDIMLAAHEMALLSKSGGGLGCDLSKIRGAGSPIKGGDLGVSSGIAPFAKMYEATILSSTQNKSRRGSAAIFLNASHPDIEFFLTLRETKGDMSKKTPDLFTGVILDDKFMQAVMDNKEYELIDPHSGKTGRFLSARRVLASITTQRHETGLPYIFFPDVANRMCLPEGQKKKGLSITQSSLCQEITSIVDHNRTGTCILSCINLAKWDDYKDSFSQMVEDIVTSLDNVAQLFIDKNSGVLGKEKAVYSTWASREIGIGWAGFHDYILSKGWFFDSPLARGFDINVTNQLREAAQKASKKLGSLRGECPDSFGSGYRNARLLTMMPTASTSQLLKTSKSIEPYQSPAYLLKSDSGNKIIKLRQLENLIGKDNPLWLRITEEGSLKDIEEINSNTKLIYRNAFEISQQSIISMASERQKAMSKNGNMTHAQSVNLFYSKGASLKGMINDIITAWELNVPSLYYCITTKNSYKQDECIACQS